MTLDYYTMAEEFNENLPEERISKTLGFVFNSESVATEVTAIDAVVAQYSGIIAAGAQDPADVLPKFLEDLNAAGMIKSSLRNRASWSMVGRAGRLIKSTNRE